MGNLLKPTTISDRELWRNEMDFHNVNLYQSARILIQPVICRFSA
jgi:hypothetical protein